MITKLEPKRSCERVGLRVPVRFQARGTSEYFNAVSDNLSAGGLCITGYQYIAPATPVMVEINVAHHVLRPVGKIAWSAPLPHSNRNRIGIEFIEMDGTDKVFLADCLGACIGKLRLLKKTFQQPHPEERR